MSSLIRRRGRKNWYLQYYVDGKRRVISLDTERRKVALQLKKKFDYEQSVGIRTQTRKTEVAEILTSYLAHYKANVRQTTYSKAKNYLRQLFGECIPALERQGTKNTRIPRKGVSCLEQELVIETFIWLLFRTVPIIVHRSLSHTYVSWYYVVIQSQQAT